MPLRGNAEQVEGSANYGAALPRHAAVTWALLGLGTLFCGLGALFMLLPAQAGALFGIPAVTTSGQGLIRAVALRDIALGLYLILQTLFATSRAVLILLICTLVIPFGDMFLILTIDGADPGQWPLHLTSAGCFGGMALWVRTSVARA